jgi:hypothetical protein
MRFKVFFDPRLGSLLLLIVLCSIVSQAHISPKRDHLTPKEADMVRDTQELDKRIAILIKAADRRLLAMTDPNATKASQIDIETWGELKGTRADFLYDLSRILDEAITNIDDVSSRDERNPLVPKSVRTLAEASSRILAGLAPFRDKVTEGPERNSYEEAVDNAQAVVEAAGKLPPPVKSDKKSDKKKSGDK